MGQLQTQSPTQSQTIDRSSKRLSDRPPQKPPPLNPIALHCISDRAEMTPDTAACSSSNGCASFDTTWKVILKSMLNKAFWR
jgi:hypothetical protein